MDCLCDVLGDDPDLAFCEDFEDPAANGFPRQAYGYADENPFALRYNAVNHEEGVCSNCAYNIVANDDGQCEVPGETDCVLDGAQAFGHRFLPGNTGGGVAETTFDVDRQFGITYAFKFSENFVDPTVALKSNEFGANNQSCLLGCSTWNTGRPNPPFDWTLRGEFPQPEVLAGVAKAFEGFGISFGVDRRAYEWRGAQQIGDDADKVVVAPGQWVCQQFHVSGWGTEAAELRTWVNGKLVQHVRGLDMRGMTGPTGQPSEDLDNPGYMVMNHYFNEGYPGDAPAYRYEDNIVITRAAEPVSCAAIGAAPVDPS